MSPISNDTAPDAAPISGLIRLLVRAWNPVSIWLFGSRARGTQGPESDWDLLVVVPDEVAEGGATDPAAGWELRRSSGVRADVVVCAASDFEDAKHVPNNLAYEAFHFGKLLLER